MKKNRWVIISSHSSNWVYIYLTKNIWFLFTKNIWFPCFGFCSARRPSQYSNLFQGLPSKPFRSIFILVFHNIVSKSIRKAYQGIYVFCQRRVSGTSKISYRGPWGMTDILGSLTRDPVGLPVCGVFRTVSISFYVWYEPFFIGCLLTAGGRGGGVGGVFESVSRFVFQPFQPSPKPKFEPASKLLQLFFF